MTAPRIRTAQCRGPRYRQNRRSPALNLEICFRGWRAQVKGSYDLGGLAQNLLETKRAAAE
jgi:hypothetical protein